MVMLHLTKSFKPLRNPLREVDIILCNFQESSLVVQHYHCRGCGFDPWSRHSDSAAAKDWRQCLLQLRPSATKYVNIKKEWLKKTPLSLKKKKKKENTPPWMSRKCLKILKSFQPLKLIPKLLCLKYLETYMNSVKSSPIPFTYTPQSSTFYHICLFFASAVSPLYFS